LTLSTNTDYFPPTLTTVIKVSIAVCEKDQRMRLVTLFTDFNNTSHTCFNNEIL